MKTLFLTGGNGDIGSAILSLFVNNGFNVIAPSRHELDLSSNQSIDEYFKLNNIEVDVIVHCAGLNNPKPLEQLTYEDIERAASVNYISMYSIIKNLAPKMREKKKGYILAISSIYGSIAREYRLPYVSSKHALIGLVQTLAIELGVDNIIVNSLSPGFVDTKMTRKNNSDEKINLLKKKIPLGRLATTEDIAEVAYFLCSDKNRFISGQDIIVDGGFLAGGFQNS